MGLNEEQKVQRSEYLENNLTITDCSLGAPYVFISYASDNWETVFKNVVVPLQKKYGLHVYADKAFDTVNDKWIVPMLRNIGRADAVIVFLSQKYIESYACYLELLTAVNKRKPVVCVAIENQLRLGKTNDMPSIEIGAKKEILKQGADISTTTNNTSNDVLRAMKSSFTSISTLLEQDALSQYDITDAFISFFRDAAINQKSVNDLNAIQGTIQSISSRVFNSELIKQKTSVNPQASAPVFYASTSVPQSTLQSVSQTVAQPVQNVQQLAVQKPVKTRSKKKYIIAVAAGVILMGGIIVPLAVSSSRSNDNNFISDSSDTSQLGFSTSSGSTTSTSEKTEQSSSSSTTSDIEASAPVSVPSESSSTTTDQSPETSSSEDTSANSTSDTEVVEREYGSEGFVTIGDVRYDIATTTELCISSNSGASGSKLFKSDVKFDKMYYYDFDTEEIEAISKLVHLTDLRIVNLKIDNFSPLLNLKELETIYLCDNGLTEDHLEFLLEFPKLKRLGWDNNKLSDFGTMYQFTFLEELSLYHCDIERNLNLLKNFTNLKALDLYSADIDDLEPQKNLTNLEWLNLCACGINNIEPLSGLANLKYLDLSYNRNLKSIEPLRNLINLEYLDIKNYEEIDDYTPLKDLKNLKTLIGISVYNENAAQIKIWLPNCEIKS